MTGSAHGSSSSSAAPEEALQPVAGPLSLPLPWVALLAGARRG